MSLIGKLEDLGLAEILQIVSLSHKSGVLELNSRGRAGAIFFLTGLVIRATTSDFAEHLGELLRKAGIIDADTLSQALHTQRNSKAPPRLGEILADDFGIDRHVIDAVVRTQIERIVFSFFTWEDGVFAFKLGEPEALAATSLDPLQFMLDSGLNPYWLAQEGTRMVKAKDSQGALTPGAAAEPSWSGNQPVLAESNDQQTFNIGVELFKELGEASGLSPQQLPQSPGLHLLRGMLEELNHPELGGDIMLLALRFASEMMNRAVIFLVKEKEIVGHGQFGIDVQGETADARVRRTRIPAGAQSLFRNVIHSMVPNRVTMDTSNPWDDYLCRQLGGEKPAEVFVGPVVSNGRVVAILYGDNLPEQRPMGDTEALEIFLSQAGLAMEKSMQTRQSLQ